MNGPTHLAIGLTLAALAGGSTPAQFAAVAVGSLLPDIDNAGAISRPLANLLPRIIPRMGIVKTIDEATELTGKLIKKVFGHRGLTHWPILAGIAWLLTQRITPLGLWLALGWLAHIYADAVTIKGAPLAAPFSLEKLRLLPKLIAFRTGGFMEDVLSFSLWGYLLALATRAVIAFVAGVL